jgi:hypothetical protein
VCFTNKLQTKANKSNDPLWASKAGFSNLCFQGHQKPLWELLFMLQNYYTRIQEVLQPSLSQNPWNLNTYYHKKKHTKKHWKKEKKKYHMWSYYRYCCYCHYYYVFTKTHGKTYSDLYMWRKAWLVVKHRCSRNKILYYICHFAQYSFTNKNTPFVPHALHISCK